MAEEIVNDPTTGSTPAETVAALKDGTFYENTPLPTTQVAPPTEEADPVETPAPVVADTKTEDAPAS